MTKSSSHQEHKDIGLIGHTCWFLLKLLGWTLIGWLIALVISCCLLLFFGEEAGLSYLTSLIQSQLLYLAKDSGPALLANVPLQTAKAAMYLLRDWLFVKTHFNSGLQGWEQGTISQDVTIKHYLTVSYFWIGIYVKALMLTTELTVLRLVIAFFMLPLFAIFGLVGLVDGLVQRDIRKFSGGRESALIYHRAKRYILKIVVAGFVLYLIVPLPVPPQWMFLPVALLFGFSIAITVRSFKKYV